MIDRTGHLQDRPRAGSGALATLALAACLAVPGADAAPISIMPMGDSITYGFASYGDGKPVPVPGGYRGFLYRDLTAAGYDVRMVGSQTGNPDPTLPAAANAHEGHVSFQIDAALPYSGLDQNLAKWLAPGNGVNPDYILLLIGINNIIAQDNAAGAPYELAALIAQIGELRPHAKVLVSTLGPLSYTTTAAPIQRFNAALEGPDGIVAQLQKLGAKVTLVNVAGRLTLADLSDGIHPNRAGYAKMADAWAAAIGLGDPVVAPEPSALALIGCGILGYLHVARSRARKDGS